MNTRTRKPYFSLNYTNKYDNETLRFIISLNPTGFLKTTAEKLNVSYDNLYQSCKLNRISYRLKKRIEIAFILSEEQKDILNSLVTK